MMAYSFVTQMVPDVTAVGTLLLMASVLRDTPGVRKSRQGQCGSILPAPKFENDRLLEENEFE